jgi:LemA protein
MEKGGFMGSSKYILIVFSLALTIAFVACSNKGISGKYVSEKNPKDYIELDPDGSFFIQEGKVGVTGKYEVKGTRITLKTDQGFASRATLEGNSLIDKDGERWIKGGNPAATATLESVHENELQTTSPSHLSQVLDNNRASAAIRATFSLGDRDKIEIQGIAEETKIVKLVKFSVNGKQAAGKMRRYDQGWRLDEVQDGLGSWLPVPTLIKQLEESSRVHREAVMSQWTQLASIYQRRADLVPGLLQTAIDASNAEKATFNAVIEARAAVGQINITNENMDDETFVRFSRAQDNLSSALARFLATLEKYPSIKAKGNYRELIAQLEGTENRLVLERMRYNEAATEYNNKITGTMIFLLGGRFGEMPALKPSQGNVPPPPVRF